MMWFEKRGIVAKVSANYCIILTLEGTFRKISLPAQETRVGAEIFYRHLRLSSPSKYKPWLMVASLLVLLMSYPILHQAILPQAVAYVSLDINPSLEMSVDKHMRVIAVHCFNDDATNLVKPLGLKGKGLNDALMEVINQAIGQDYITAGQNNLMISTVSPSGTAPDPVDQVALYQVLENSMASRGYTGQVKIYAASDDFHRAAGQMQLSAGKYLIYEQLIKSGKNVSVDDIRRQNVRQLADTYNLDLLPNYKKVMLQTAQTNQDVEITVDDNGQNVTVEDYAKRHGFTSDAGEVHFNQPDANVSRSYPPRKSRLAQTEPTTGLAINPELAGENSIKTVAGFLAAETPIFNAAGLKKSGI